MIGGGQPVPETMSCGRRAVDCVLDRNTGEPTPLSSKLMTVVLRDGTKVDTIVHYGRRIPALLRSVLELGDPERLDGAVCVEAGCDRRHHLEWDHDDPGGSSATTV